MLSNILILPLFPAFESISKSTSGLDENSYPERHPFTTNPQMSIESALNSIFPKSIEETKVIQARGLLGDVAKTLSSEQIEVMVTKFQFLINTWLDEYERDIFKGKTLKEVLNEGEI